MKRALEGVAFGQGMALLKNTGPAKVLATKIGNLQMELWEYPKGDAEPYACLIGKETRARLSPLQAFLLCTAIEEWKGAWNSGFAVVRKPDLRLDLDNLTLHLYLPKGRRPPRGVCLLGGSEDRSESVTLSQLEMMVFSNTLATMVHEEEDEHRSGGFGEHCP